tara:strand:+ start:29 stop:136 length:108 start_codon:yes stop_codon:yes gene_type:complete
MKKKNKPVVVGFVEIVDIPLYSFNSKGFPQNLAVE